MTSSQLSEHARRNRDDLEGPQVDRNRGPFRIRALLLWATRSLLRALIFVHRLVTPPFLRRRAPVATSPLRRGKGRAA